MKVIKISSTDVILENYEFGSGKIIVSDIYNGSFSYVWGAMGSTIEDFLKSINSEYFVNKLTTKDEIFCGKRSTKNLRKAIRDEFNWFEYMEAQKELREKIKDIEGVDNEHEFVYMCGNLSENIYCFDFDEYSREDFFERLESILVEPWNYIGTKPSYESIFLTKLHKKLKKELI